MENWASLVKPTTCPNPKKGAENRGKNHKQNRPVILNVEQKPPERAFLVGNTRRTAIKSRVCRYSYPDLLVKTSKKSDWDMAATFAHFPGLLLPQNKKTKSCFPQSPGAFSINFNQQKTILPVDRRCCPSWRMPPSFYCLWHLQPEIMMRLRHLPIHAGFQGVRHPFPPSEILHLVALCSPCISQFFQCAALTSCFFSRIRRIRSTATASNTSLGGPVVCSGRSKRLEFFFLFP